MTDLQFRPLTRKSGYRDAKLIVIACEGNRTEKKYFEDLASSDEFRNPRVRVEVLDRISTSSSPSHVLALLDQCKRHYGLHPKDGDQLWLVFDIDRWTTKMVNDVIKQSRDKRYHVAESNPCFEVWLLMHVKSLSEYNEKQMRALTTNSKVKNRNRLETELKTHCGGRYNKSNPDTSIFIKLVNSAVENAKQSDTRPSHRWLNQIGSRVYKLVESIINSST